MLLYTNVCALAVKSLIEDPRILAILVEHYEAKPKDVGVVKAYFEVGG